MGMATYQETGYRKPAWAEGYKNLAHCKNCDAVFSKTTEFVRGFNVRNGTMPSEFVPIAKCKKGCCPVCSTPIEEEQ